MCVKLNCHLKYTAGFPSPLRLCHMSTESLTNRYIYSLVNYMRLLNTLLLKVRDHFFLLLFLGGISSQFFVAQFNFLKNKNN